MDTRLFYGSKQKDLCVRQIQSDSEDSEIDSSDSEEEWNGEQGLSRSEKITSKVLTVALVIIKMIRVHSRQHLNEVKYQAIVILVVFSLVLETYFFIYF